MIRGANGWVRGCHGGFDGICHTCKRVFTRSTRRERGEGGDSLMIFVTLANEYSQGVQGGRGGEVVGREGML